MDGSGMRFSAALLAAIPAGPVYVAAWFAAELYLRLPAPVTVDPVEIAQVIAIMIPGVFAGILFAIVPLLFGTLLMSACAERWEAARSGPAWAAAGAAGGAGIALLLAASGPAAFALMATSAVCGWLARRGVEL